MQLLVLSPINMTLIFFWVYHGFRQNANIFADFSWKSDNICGIAYWYFTPANSRKSVASFETYRPSPRNKKKNCGSVYSKFTESSLRLIPPTQGEGGECLICVEYVRTSFSMDEEWHRRTIMGMTTGNNDSAENCTMICRISPHHVHLLMWPWWGDIVVVDVLIWIGDRQMTVSFPQMPAVLCR